MTSRFKQNNPSQKKSGKKKTGRFRKWGLYNMVLVPIEIDNLGNHPCIDLSACKAFSWRFNWHQLYKVHKRPKKAYSSLRQTLFRLTCSPQFVYHSNVTSMIGLKTISQTMSNWGSKFILLFLFSCRITVESSEEESSWGRFSNSSIYLPYWIK